MCRFFGRELATVELAMQLSEYLIFHVLLQQCREKVLQLQAQWPSPLVPAAHYTSRAHEANQLAQAVVGIPTSSNPPLQWLLPLVCSAPIIIEEEDDTEPEATMAITLAEDTDIPPKQVLLVDVLEDSDHKDDELELHKPDVAIHWNVLENLSADIFKVPATPWRPPTSIVEQIRPATKGFRDILFEVKDIQILADPEGHLNNICVNDCAALIYSKTIKHVESQVAIFSTHDLPCIRY
ncbi:hypothetical protein J3R82DRAFT_174 [Butyriboletus roseoflavus]|nr:hypothetical protein J3R82DRAFT_174 [Butyriboletus roseoflavus]